VPNNIAQTNLFMSMRGQLAKSAHTHAPTHLPNILENALVELCVLLLRGVLLLGLRGIRVAVSIITSRLDETNLMSSQLVRHHFSLDAAAVLRHRAVPWLLVASRFSTSCPRSLSQTLEHSNAHHRHVTNPLSSPLP